VGVASGPEDPVAENREVSLDPSFRVAASAGRGGRRPLRQARDVGLFAAATTGSASLRGRGPVGFRTIFPDQIAGGPVERLDDSPRARQVHDAVVNERRRFLRARIVHGPRPCELKLPGVLPVDLIQRTVAPGVVGPPPVQPVARGGVAQHGLGDRTIVPDLRLNPVARQQHDDQHRNSGPHLHRPAPDVVADLTPPETRQSG
jgi:hypothetical protein